MRKIFDHFTNNLFSCDLVDINVNLYIYNKWNLASVERIVSNWQSILFELGKWSIRSNQGLNEEQSDKKSLVLEAKKLYVTVSLKRIESILHTLPLYAICRWATELPLILLCKMYLNFIMFRYSPRIWFYMSV